MSPLIRASKSLQIASMNLEYGITSDFGVTQKTSKLSPDETCLTVIHSVIDELVKAKTEIHVKDCIQLKNAVVAYAQATGAAINVKSKTVLLIELLALRILGYSKENILTKSLEITLDTAEQMTEKDRIDNILRLTVDFSKTPVLKLALMPTPDEPFSCLLQPITTETHMPPETYDWRLKHIIKLANIKLALEKGLGRIAAIGSKTIEVNVVKLMKIMKTEAAYLFSLQECTKQLDIAFTLINSHQTQLTSKLFHYAGRENRIAIFPVQNEGTIEELSLQLQTLHVIKHIIVKGISWTDVKPLIAKIRDFQLANTGNHSFGAMLIDFLNINEIIYNVYIFNEMIIKRTKENSTNMAELVRDMGESTPSVQRMLFYSEIANLINQSLKTLTADNSNTKLAIDCIKLFQTINSTITTVQALTTAEGEHLLFERLEQTQVKSLSKKNPRQSSKITKEITERYRETIRLLNEHHHITQVDRILIDIIRTSKDPIEEPKPFIDLSTISKTTKKINPRRRTRPRKSIISAAPTKQSTDVLTKSLKNVSLKGVSKPVPKKLPNSAISSTEIIKAAPFFDYHERVTRWFIYKIGSKKDPIICDKTYSTADLSDDDKHYKRFQHSFAIEVDRFVKKYGIKNTGTERLKKLGVEIQYQIAAEVTIRLPSGLTTIRGICNYSIRKKCFHRHFTPFEYEQINREFTENGFWHIDYPGSPSEVISLDSSVTDTTHMQIDGSYVKYKNKNIVVIEDPKNLATITLALTKM